MKNYMSSAAASSVVGGSAYLASTGFGPFLGSGAAAPRTGGAFRILGDPKAEVLGTSLSAAGAEALKAVTFATEWSAANPAARHRRARVVSVIEDRYREKSR